jgi:geranylgeranyl diphosphate synthase, type II
MSSLIPNSRIDYLQKSIEVGLDSYLATPFAGPARLIEAMRYAVLSPGKRLRGMLCLLIAEDLNCLQATIPAACALELLHAASLIIDDLPCMDDEKERRGRPATHMAFGQDLAILAAFSLVSRAFNVISTMSSPDAGACLHITSLFSEALGANGLCAGQARDLTLSLQGGSGEDYDGTIMQKTAALFILAVLCGAVFAAPALSGSEEEILKCFATHLGIAFQAYDDALDGSGIALPAALMGRAAQELRAAGSAARQLTRLPSLTSYLESGWCVARDDLRPVTQVPRVALKPKKLTRKDKPVDFSGRQTR